MSIGLWVSTVVGNLGRDPELTTLPSGTKICKFSIAVNRSRRGEEKTSWVNVVAFEKLGELCAQYLTKGSRVLVIGDTEISQWTNRDGESRQSIELTANKITFLDKKGDTPARQDTSDSSYSEPPLEGGLSDEDIPF